MVRTGARVAELGRLLGEAGMRSATRVQPSPRLSDLPASLQDELLALYRLLGGVLQEPRLRPGSWDLAFDDGLLVELDEEFHFTRYRRQTLDGEFERVLPWAGDYRTFIDLHEARAIAPGGRWSNASTDRMFGGSDPVGQFQNRGSSRWKQRALYDSVKDAAAASGLVRLSRVSIYDVVEGLPLDRVLYGGAAVDAGALQAFVRSRASA